MHALKRLTALLILSFSTMLNAQNYKPSIMLMPSKFWMVDRGYTIKYDNQGLEAIELDYDKALKGDKDLISVLNSFGSKFMNYGFQVESFENAYNNYKQDTVNKLGGFSKADIRIELNWKIEQLGPKKRLSQLSIVAFDSYTDKVIGMIESSGEMMMASISNTEMLNEAFYARIDQLNVNINAYTDDILKNGQEINLRVVTSGEFQGDLESIYNGVELATIIEDWISKNAVNNRYQVEIKTKRQIRFSAIRRPIFEEGQQINSHIWVSKLATELREKYNVPCKVESRNKFKTSLIIG